MLGFDSIYLKGDVAHRKQLDISNLNKNFIYSKQIYIAINCLSNMTSQSQKLDRNEYEERPQSVSSNEPDLERLRTKGGHIDSRDQPSLPVIHRSFANPAPLGLLSFATGVFLLSLLGVHARGIVEKNILVGVFVFFGGICQFISGIMEFVAGNTVCSHTKETRNLNAV